MYGVVGGEIAGEEQLYFQMKFSKEIEESEVATELDSFTNFLKFIRGIIRKAGGSIESLQDDISSYYSKGAYPIIHEVENVMRRLITNFMLVTVGKRWLDRTAPSEILSVIDKSTRKDSLSALDSVDFNDLANFYLLKPYSKHTTESLYKEVARASSAEDLPKLKELIPKSNWQRYFSKLVSFEDEQLKSKWAELYLLRCKVAHNAVVSKGDFERITELSDELKSKLQAAINNLPSVVIAEEDREVIAENAENESMDIGDFALAVVKMVAKIHFVKSREGVRIEGRISNKVKYLVSIKVLSTADQTFIDFCLLANEDREFMKRFLDDAEIKASVERMNYITSMVSGYIDIVNSSTQRFDNGNDLEIEDRPLTPEVDVTESPEP